MTPKQHFRSLQIRLEIAEFGMGMPLDRERVKELREQVEQARKDAEDIRYQRVRCSACGKIWQNIDFGCALHRLTCDAVESAELDTMTSDGAEQ